KKIAKEEIKELKRCVREEWLKVEDTVDEFGEDAAFQIESVFEWLAERHEKPENAFQEFENYYVSHKKIFSPSIRTLVVNTCEKIATAYASKNKAEVALLKQVKTLLGR
ncbi:MAG TPA: hypothetical protein VL947_04500, partial [Cytophagales bacterium]|nr:hypothetical protein [Cytophagales bacterium]